MDVDKVVEDIKAIACRDAAMRMARALMLRWAKEIPLHTRVEILDDAKELARVWFGGE